MPTSTAYRPNVADRPSEVTDRPGKQVTGSLQVTGMVQCLILTISDRPVKRPLTGMMQCLILTISDRPVKRPPTGMMQCLILTISDRPDKRCPLTGMVQCLILTYRPNVADRPNKRFPLTGRLFSLTGMVQCNIADRPYVADRPDKRFPMTSRLFSLTGIFQKRFPDFSLLALLCLLFLHTRHCCCCCCCSKPLKPNLQFNTCIIFLHLEAFLPKSLPMEYLFSKSRNLSDRPDDPILTGFPADRPVKRFPLTGRLFSLTGMVQCNVADRPGKQVTSSLQVTGMVQCLILTISDRPGDKRCPLTGRLLSLTGMVQCNVADRPYVADQPSKRFH